MNFAEGFVVAVKQTKARWFLTGAIIFIVIITLIFSFRHPKNIQETSSKLILPTPAPTQVVVNKGTGLTLSPQNLTLRPGQAFTFDVMLNNPGNMVSAADVKIVFDPDILSINKPEVGNVFADQVILDNNVDNKRGLITISLGSTSPASQSGTLVHLTGFVNQGITGETDLIILPESKITWTGSSASILEQTGQATISVIVL